MSNKSEDKRILLEFISTYCRHHHQGEDKKLFVLDEQEIKICPECCELAEYAVLRREKCPKDPKPACKDCDTQCYHPRFKEKIRQVMRYSGLYYIKQGRLDYLVKYFKRKL
jgi:hypothetical protein